MGHAVRVHHFERRLTLPVPRQQLFAWHERPGAFERLAPSWEDLEVVERHGGIHDDARLHFRLRQGPFTVNWIARHQGYAPPQRFEDVAEHSPFATWHHVHRFEAIDDEHSTLIDGVDYELPIAAIADPLFGATVERMLERMFRQRHLRTANDLRRHLAYADRPPLRVAISGASGMIGSALAAFLRTGGHAVLPLVRGEGAEAPAQAVELIRWDPQAGAIDTPALEGLDAVVHLAGESVAGRWTSAKREAIRRSREEGTALLSRALAGLQHKPKVLVCASAIGFYGDGDERERDEQSPSGEGFLAAVVRAWEQATDSAAAADIRVVKLRLGVVLSPHGGALRQLLRPASLGLGGPLGDGRQWQSTIDLDDLLAVILHAIHDERLQGPVNAVGLEPVRQRTLAACLGAVLHRPSALRIPAPLIRGLLGDMGDEVLLFSQRVVPRRLQETGFRWDFPRVEDSLRHQLGRTDDDQLRRAIEDFTQSAHAPV